MDSILERPNEELRKLRDFYTNGRPVTKMGGEMPDLLRVAAREGLVVGFTLSFTHKEVYAEVLGFNDITGRITVRGGDKREGHGWVRSFLIKQVKMFTFSEAHYDAYRRERRA